MSTREERVAKRDKHPDTFIPVDEGDTITGTLMDVREGYSDQRRGNPYYPILIIRVNDRDIAWHAFGAVAESEVMRLEPLPGEVVTVTYHGVGKPKPGQSGANLYRVTVGGRSMEDTAKRAYGNLRRSRSGSQPATERTERQPEPPDADDDIPY